MGHRGEQVYYRCDRIVFTVSVARQRQWSDEVFRSIPIVSKVRAADSVIRTASDSAVCSYRMRITIHNICGHLLPCLSITHVRAGKSTS